MHAENLLEPWIALRLMFAVTTAALLLSACKPSWTAWRKFDASRANEGQLLLERRFELAATTGKLGAILLVAGALLTAIAAQQVHGQIRGAMCAYGVFQAHPSGFSALWLDLFGALAGGVLWQLHRIETELPRLDLVKPLSLATFALSALACLALVFQIRFWLGLDRSVVATCCSLELDASLLETRMVPQDSPTVLALLATLAALAALVSCALAARAPSRSRLLWASALTVLAVPLSAMSITEFVAPHVFETPVHRCPFCLLDADAAYLGFFLYAALLWGASRVLGVWLSALLLPRGHQGFLTAAKPSLRSAALGWGALLLGAALPVARFYLLYDARSLFP